MFSETDQLLSEHGFDLNAECGKAVDFAGFADGERVLDVATGSGRMLLQLLQRGHTVVSGDMDAETLEIAKGRLGDLTSMSELVVLDGHSIGFENDTFHSATLANAIHEIDKPQGVLDEMKRVLRTNGKLLVTEFNAAGFELMEINHRRQGRGKHPTGEMSTMQIDSYLRDSFSSVEAREFEIIHAWTATGKR